MKKQTSSFGRGLAYNLGLFLAHERDQFIFGKYKNEELNKSEKRKIELWFYSSSDHLYDIEISKKIPKKLQERIKLLQNKCLSWGHSFGIGGWEYGEPNKESLEWALKEAREVLMEIDKLLEIKSEKGEWE